MTKQAAGKAVHVTIDKEHVEVGRILGPSSGAAFATYYDPNRDTGIGFTHEETRTHQSFAGECDINAIVKKGLATGVWPSGGADPQYGDFSEVDDYRAAIDIVRNAEAMFQTLPAEVRRSFDNDPAKFLEFASNPANSQALVDMGLATQVVPPVTETSPEPAQAPKKADKAAPEPKGEKS